jgi:hypothetical protein
LKTASFFITNQKGNTASESEGQGRWGLRQAAEEAARGAASKRCAAAGMADLIPWKRSREIGSNRGRGFDPFVTLRQEMDRLLDESFRGFGLSPFRTRDRF